MAQNLTFWKKKQNSFRNEKSLFFFITILQTKTGYCTSNSQIATRTIKSSVS